MKNLVEQINELGFFVKEMKQITNTIEYRKNKGLTKDVALDIELSIRKTKAIKILESLSYKVSNRLIDIIDTTDMEITIWLTQNKDVLSFNSIETKYGIPQGTLGKVVKGDRPLPKKWIPVLTAWQEQMCGGAK